MRCYQHIGLTGEAEKFLNKHVVMLKKPCPRCNCGEVSVRKVLKEEQEDLFYGDGPILCTYELKNGLECKEVVQCVPWSSGPMGFLCLEIDGKQICKWTEEEVDDISR